MADDVAVIVGMDYSAKCLDEVVKEEQASYGHADDVVIGVVD